MNALWWTVCFFFRLRHARIRSKIVLPTKVLKTQLAYFISIALSSCYYCLTILAFLSIEIATAWRLRVIILRHILIAYFFSNKSWLKSEDTSRRWSFSRWELIFVKRFAAMVHLNWTLRSTLLAVFNWTFGLLGFIWRFHKAGLKSCGLLLKGWYADLFDIG